MTGSAGCAQAAPLLGVYVLGAIDPPERAVVDGHLRSCSECRDELASLAGLPALLGHVTEEQLAAVGAPPPEPLEAVLRRVTAERHAGRRRSRVWLVAAAAAAVITTGIGVVEGLRIGAERSAPVATSSVSPPAADGWTVSGMNTATGVSASITMYRKEWGTAFTVWLTGAPHRAHCRLVIVGKNGSLDIAGGWAVGAEGYREPARFEGSSMIPSDQIQSVELRSLDGRRMLVIPV